MRVVPVTLEGRFVRLEPLSEIHASDLLAYTARDTFTHFLDPDPQWTLEGWRGWVRDAAAQAGRLAFAVIDRQGLASADGTSTNRVPAGACIGSSSFMDIRERHRGVEIGFTFYAPGGRGTPINPECKLLMLRHAFEAWGCERVQLKCDGRNVRSQAAIAKLGAVREGVLRRHMVVRDGFVRDTVMFSIVREEWPRVRDGLLARLPE